MIPGFKLPAPPRQVNGSFGRADEAFMSTSIYVYGGIDEDDELYRDDLEDALRGLEKGVGQLTGAGTSFVEGFNVDLSLPDGEDIDSWTLRLVNLLKRLGAGPRTYFEIYPSGWKQGMPYRRVEVSGKDQWLTAQEQGAVVAAKPKSKPVKKSPKKKKRG